MKKIAFITGISGMVGSHLVDYLKLNTDWEIHGLIRWNSKLDNLEHHLDDVNKKKRIFFYYGDLRDSQSLDIIFRKIKPNYVFHLAAQSYPLTSFSSPIDTYETNILGTSKLLQSIKTHSPDSLVHICSSSEVFGKVDKSKVPIKEDCEFHPSSPYGISKIGTDCIAKFYHEAYNLKILTTRMFTHTGPRRGDVFAESSFAKQIALVEAGKLEPIIKVGNLESKRTIADVRDAVRAYFLLLTKNPIPGNIYNIGGNYICTIKDILEYLISLSKVKIDYKIDKERLRVLDADLQIPDSSKFVEHTGWDYKFTFEQTMTDLLNYWRDNIIKKERSYLDR